MTLYVGDSNVVGEDRDKRFLEDALSYCKHILELLEDKNIGMAKELLMHLAEGIQKELL